MPYLKKSQKDLIDESGLWGVEDYFKKMKPDEFAGAINYMNFKLIKTWIDTNGKKYWIFALFCGTIVCCLLEVYRRLVAPYEDQKIKENGDV